MIPNKLINCFLIYHNLTFTIYLKCFKHIIIILSVCLCCPKMSITLMSLLHPLVQMYFYCQNKSVLAFSHQRTHDKFSVKQKR